MDEVCPEVVNESDRASSKAVASAKSSSMQAIEARRPQNLGGDHRARGSRELASIWMRGSACFGTSTACDPSCRSTLER